MSASWAMLAMKSNSPSLSVNRGELEDLVDEVLQTYRAVASAIGKLEGAEQNGVYIEARNVCQRLEAIMELLEEESLDPELGPDELSDSVQALISEAKSLEGQLKALVAKLQSHGR